MKATVMPPADPHGRSKFGTPDVVVPDVLGMKVADANKRLRAAGLRVRVIDPMARANAAFALMADHSNRRPSKASYKRVLRALKILEIEGEGRARLLRYLEYTDPNDNLYSRFA